ncbi:DUF943 family protein [Pseudomonas graminis]
MSKKIRIIMLMVAFLGGCLLWLWYRPVEVIAVHQRGNNSTILVKDYPLTDKGKIEWWLKNKSMMKTKYATPQPEADGSYNVILWDFYEGYKELDKYDRLCFDDMKPPVNCVDKNSLMIISRNKYNVTKFIGDDGVYVLQDNGLIIKRRAD